MNLLLINEVVLHLLKKLKGIFIEVENVILIYLNMCRLFFFKTSIDKKS